MVQVFEAWGYFIPYIFIVGVLKIITDIAYRALTEGRF